MLGKLNMSELALGGTRDPLGGIPRNPWDLERIPSGSSGGAAVSVALEMCAGAVASDTGGSVRIPASFNGLTGYKSTEGHIDKTGAQPLSLTLDSVGPLGRSVEDCVLIERALRRAWVVSPRPAGLEDFKLVVPENFVFDDAEDAVGANFEAMVSKLSAAGVAIERRTFDVFGEMNGRGFGVKRVLQGIQKATAVGLHPIKVNTVVQKGVNDHTIIDLLRYFKGTGVIVRFIEYMDVGNINGWKLDQVIPSADMLQWINAEMPLEPVNKNYSGEVADRYRYLDGSGEIGFISSVTEAFCSDCTRARLSTDGKLYTCLFAEDGRDLRGPMRAGASDADLEALITDVWGQRTDRYSQIRASLIEPPQRKVEMYQIGG